MFDIQSGSNFRKVFVWICLAWMVFTACCITTHARDLDIKTRESSASFSSVSASPISASPIGLYRFYDHTESYRLMKWYDFKSRRPEKKTLLHFDTHGDMRFSVDIPPTWCYNSPQASLMEKARCLDDYVNDALSVSSWIAPYAYEGRLNRVYWVVPDFAPDSGTMSPHFGRHTYYSYRIISEEGTLLYLGPYKPEEALSIIRKESEGHLKARLAGKVESLEVHILKLDDLPAIEGDIFLDIDLDYFSSTGYRDSGIRHIATVKEYSQTIDVLTNTLRKKNIHPVIMTMAYSPAYAPGNILMDLPKQDHLGQGIYDKDGQLQYVQYDVQFPKKIQSPAIAAYLTQKLLALYPNAFALPEEPSIRELLDHLTQFFCIDQTHYNDQVRMEFCFLQDKVRTALKLQFEKTRHDLGEKFLGHRQQLKQSGLMKLQLEDALSQCIHYIETDDFEGFFQGLMAVARYTSPIGYNNNPEPSSLWDYLISFYKPGLYPDIPVAEKPKFGFQ